MQPSRRQFVTASLAGFPLLVPGTVAVSQGRAPNPRPRASDPVIDRITANLRELVAEGDAAPSARKGTARAIEATLGVLATHLELHYDPSLTRALKQREARTGRAALVDDLVRVAREHKQEVTHEAIHGALTALERRGLAGCIRDGCRVIRDVRLQAPDAVLAAGAPPARIDFCLDLIWMIDLITWVAALVCGFSILEPTVGGEIACGGITVYLGSLQALKWWFC